jgi:histidine triad (HIT) family protein
MSDCIFCDIIAGNAPFSPVWRDDACLAFMDIQPVNAGHVLVVPTQHAVGLEDLDPEAGAHLFRIAQRIAGALRRSGLPCQGINLFLADGEVAMQEVFHLHLHVLPRFAGDGFGLKFAADYGRKPPRDALDEAAARIRNAL